jgi:uncharacterized membrane protein
MKTTNYRLRMLGKTILLSIFVYYLFLMIIITLQYIPIDFTAAFLATKQNIIHYIHYQLSFFSHVYSSIVILIVGALQFSNYIRTKHSHLHRILGYIYTFGILCISAPAGFIMGFYGFGGLSATISFLLLSVLWFVFTLKAFLNAKKRRYLIHQRYMILSYSLTLSAITLRLVKQILHIFSSLGRVDIYVIATWIGWILNLVIALFIVYGINRKSTITSKAS